ncbi:MAG: selenide, water dikinase SelD [Acidimicrobiia bacterium]
MSSNEVPTDPVEIKLTTLARGGGCACKLSPADLETVLSMVNGFGAIDDDRLLVGFAGSDDAAVYKLTENTALVFTTDFFSPVVDDPYDFGRIAATNALSDVYAMGGTPLIALNLVAFPREAVPLSVLSRILDGGQHAARDATCLVVGGHSIDDPEPKYGMAVIGTVHPDKIITNSGARPGDVLVLTKPLGIGAITTGIKRGASTPAQIDAAITLMTTSNRAAASAASAVGIGATRAVHAGTDVTGFGLFGHLHEMAKGSGLHAIVDADSVPILDGAIDLLRSGVVAGGTQRNHDWLGDRVHWNSTPEAMQFALTDAQTSGGLLLACRPDAVEQLIGELSSQGTPCAAVIGTLANGEPGTISAR